MLRFKRGFYGCLKGIFLITMVGLEGCLFGGGKPPGSIVGYRDGLVLMHEGSYRVGTLPATWKPVSFKYKSLAFREAGGAATVATNAFCEESYDDAPLKALTRHLYIGVDHVKVSSQSEKMLAGRQSLWTVWSGTMDGVPVQLETITVKKDHCLFDFYYVTFPSDFATHRGDFHRFVEGFSYP